jgi:hypothetical protein
MTDARLGGIAGSRSPNRPSAGLSIFLLAPSAQDMSESLEVEVTPAGSSSAVAVDLVATLIADP